MDALDHLVRVDWFFFERDDGFGDVVVVDPCQGFRVLRVNWSNDRAHIQVITRHALRSALRSVLCVAKATRRDTI